MASGFVRRGGRWLVVVLVWLTIAWVVHLAFSERPASGGAAPRKTNWTTAGGMEPILPLPAAPNTMPERVALGERLFRDTRLSADGSISCASCHNLDNGGDDDRPFSIGIGGAKGDINAPTVINAAFNFVQFWDGRAASLEEQAAGPIHNPVEMGSSWSQVLERLGNDRALLKDFLAAYPDGLTSANVADAIASFERSLITSDSAFDRYLKGDENALSEQEKNGYLRFRSLGCVSCHQGRLVGGNMYQKFGVLGDYFATKTPSKSDFGRYNVTGREEDKHVFKVPSLRMVVKTAPYFHDGSIVSLAEAILVMGRFQLGRDLSVDDVDAIAAFLATLSSPPTGAAR